MEKNEKLPKNRFAEPDRLEEREHLDENFMNSGNGVRGKTFFDPITTLPYNAMFAYPFPAIGYTPVAFPLDTDLYDYQEDNGKEF